MKSICKPCFSPVKEISLQLFGVFLLLILIQIPNERRVQYAENHNLPSHTLWYTFASFKIGFCTSVQPLVWSGCELFAPKKDFFSPETDFYFWPRYCSMVFPEGNWTDWCQQEVSFRSRRIHLWITLWCCLFQWHASLYIQCVYWAFSISLWLL